jgi:hypothetical protein
MKTEPSPISSFIKICLLAPGFFHVNGRGRKYARCTIPNAPRTMGRVIIWAEIHGRAISQSSPSKRIKLLYLPLISKIHAVWVNNVCGWLAEMDVYTAIYTYILKTPSIIYIYMDGLFTMTSVPPIRFTAVQ